MGDYRLPVDTADKFYLAASDGYVLASNGENLLSLWEIIQVKWPGITMDKIRISAEHIQVKCFGYDLYDSGDYRDFLVIERLG